MTDLENVIRNTIDTVAEVASSNIDREEYPYAPSLSNVASLTTLPENSRSIEVVETTSRFSSALWFNIVQQQDIILAGLGGIGSYVAFLLGRVRPRKLVMFDSDIVEIGNMSGQMFTSNDVGEYKVRAAFEKLNSYSNYYARYVTLRYSSSSETTNIMICGFDNMEARKVFYENWKRHVSYMPQSEKGKCLFIDGRLAAESFQVFCIKGDDTYYQEVYERDWLFSGDEADATVCSYKQTSYMANMIASIMNNLFINFCANQADPLFPRDVPFLTSYEGDMMYFKTEY